MDFKISVVMAVYNKQKYVSQAIESVINQTLDFKKNIQIILVNDKSTDGTSDILEKYHEKYPDNITVINNPQNMGPAYSRNRGLEHVRGKYVNFLDSDDYISKDAFKRAYNFLEKYYEVDIVSVPIYFVGVKRGPHNLNFKYRKDQIVNVITEPDHIQLSGASAFFRFSKLKNYSFNENLKVSEDSLLINRMLLDNPLLGCLSKPKYYYRKDGSANSLITSSASDKTYFTTRLDEYFFKLISYAKSNYRQIPKFIQYVVMYDLQWIFEIEVIDNLLDLEEIKTLYTKLMELLSHVGVDVVLNQLSIPAALKAHIILIKRHGWQYLLGEADITDDFNMDTVFLDNFQFINGHEILVEGIFTDFSEDTEIFAEVDGRSYPTQKIRYPQRDNFSLNFNYGYNHNFRAVMPFCENSCISFASDKKNLSLDYNPTSRLNKISGFKLSKSHIAKDCGDKITIIKKKYSNALFLELKTILRMFTRRQDGWRTGVFIRVVYILSYPFMRNRKIWIFMDLPNAAGDNALAMFRYVSGIATDSENYFVLNKTHEDEIDFLVSSKLHKFKKMFDLIRPDREFEKVNKIGKILPYRSIKHRIYTLFAEFIITSHPDNTLIYPFWGNYSHVSGLARSKTVFLQHGVTKDNVSEWLNAFDKQLAMMVCVSDRERESFTNPDYGYCENIIKTLGFPRFDSLKDDSQKRIVLMPSWRRQLDDVSKEEFMRSNFYDVYNSLINDDELLDFIDDKGYRLVFKPHRNLQKFINTFERPCSVEFDTDLENYTETFNTASLLITDYSSVFFDFAYLKKPVIYYHFDDGYHFNQEKSYFKYERDGFGPVAYTKDELKRYIVSIVENGCEMDGEYRLRVDDFFRYRDCSNCERVYDEITRLDTYY